MTQIAFPLHFDGRGRTAEADEDRHVRDLIERVLLTSPGERVMRPTFGSTVKQLLFAGNSPELAATTQFVIQGSLQQWLGDRIAVEAVDVEPQDATLVITIKYLVRRTQVRSAAQFSVPGGVL